MTALVVVIGGAISFTAIYQAFKIGSFLTGSLPAAVLAWPLIRYWLARRDPAQAPHLTNYLQTAVSTCASAVGMGSMLLAFQWVTGRDLSFFEVVAIALPGSLFGYAVVNLFAESWINVQQLTFPSGFAAGEMLKGFAQGGKLLHLLIIGASISIPLVFFESPLGAVAIGAGWIVGWEVMAWALLTALVFSHFEPAMKDAGFIDKAYREFTVYLGASMILAAGTVDILFIFFSKGKVEGRSRMGTLTNFMARKTNLLLLAGGGLFAAISMKAVLGLPFFTTLGMAALLVVLAYIGGTCQGKTDLGPVSVLSGFVILLTSTLGKSSAVLYGALAGQTIAGGIDQGEDYRTGAQVGSHFPLQRIFQIIGACLGASVFLGLMYSLLTSAYSEHLTLEAAKTKGNLFDLGFAMKYYGLLGLREKLGGPVGTICFQVLALFVGLHLVRNFLNAKGYTKLARLCPSGYACSFAALVTFDTTMDQSFGALIGVLFLGLWSGLGRKVKDPVTQEPEPQLARVNWSHMIGLPSGLMVGEGILEFFKALAVVMK